MVIQAVQTSAVNGGKGFLQEAAAVKQLQDDSQGATLQVTTSQTSGSSPGSAAKSASNGKSDDGKIHFPGNFWGAVNTLVSAQHAFFPAAWNWLNTVKFPFIVAGWPLPWFGAGWNGLVGVLEVASAAESGSKAKAVDGLLNLGMAATMAANLTGAVAPLPALAVQAGLYAAKVLMDAHANRAHQQNGKPQQVTP